MATIDEALRSQVRNIEARYGRTMDEWAALLGAAGLTKHGQMVALLKSTHGLSHGDANRVALIALAGNTSGDAKAEADPADALYEGRKAGLRPIHDRLLAAVRELGEVEIAPKKAYLSLRRRKQFALIQPAAAHVDLGLILDGKPERGRLEPAGSFNAMFTHRVRVRTAEEVDAELVGWLREAYDQAS